MLFPHLRNGRAMDEHYAHMIADLEGNVAKMPARPGEYPFFVQSRPPWIPPLQHERLIEGLRKAGLTV